MARYLFFQKWIKFLTDKQLLIDLIYIEILRRKWRIGWCISCKAEETFYAFSQGQYELIELRCTHFKVTIWQSKYHDWYLFRKKHLFIILHLKSFGPFINFDFFQILSLSKKYLRIQIKYMHSLINTIDLVSCQ